MEDKKEEVVPDYIGPTSNVEKIPSYKAKTTGVDAGCASCCTAHSLEGDGRRYVSTSYVTSDGVRHYHVYLANYGV